MQAAFWIRRRGLSWEAVSEKLGYTVPQLEALIDLHHERMNDNLYYAALYRGLLYRDELQQERETINQNAQ